MLTLRRLVIWRGSVASPVLRRRVASESSVERDHWRVLANSHRPLAPQLPLCPEIPNRHSGVIRSHQMGTKTMSKRLKGLYPGYRCTVFRMRDLNQIWNFHWYRSLGTVYLSKVSVTPPVESRPRK